MVTFPAGMSGSAGMFGILGGGQLGRMLALAAARMGLDVCVLSPERDCPAGRVASAFLHAEYDDEAALSELADRCGVVTFEFENVPAEALEFLAAKDIRVFPQARALRIAQDRLEEKRFFASIGLAVTAHCRIDGPEEIRRALDELGAGILKVRHSGYDGRGQMRLEPRTCDPVAAWESIGSRPALFEQLVNFEREIAVLLARGEDGSVMIYDIPHNTHEGGILLRSEVPAGVSDHIAVTACQMGVKLAEALDYVGVLALELFVMPDGDLLAGEFAPRVHNSGHWTEDACVTGQFTQHVRAVCGLALGSATRLCDVSMENLLGASGKLAPVGMERSHFYGKRLSKPNRKMGHTTRLILPDIRR